MRNDSGRTLVNSALEMLVRSTELPAAAEDGEPRGEALPVFVASGKA